MIDRRQGKRTNNDPRGLGAVHGLQAILQPSSLLVHDSEWAFRESLRSIGLIGTNVAVAEIGLGVKLDVMRHPVIERVPKVLDAAGLLARHAEVVTVTREVSLARHAYTGIVRDVLFLVSCPCVVAVCLVVSGANHVRLERSDRGHIVVEGVQDRLIDLVSLSDSGVREETLDLLL